MILSKQKLYQEASETGFRAEILEKVFILMDLLNELTIFPQIKNKWALKGGTALNLFYFNLPRLSVDIDLNYIGNVEREAMLIDRPIVESALIAICQRKGLSLDRNPNVHAGGKMVWKYPSALGQIGNLEIDLNFMYRQPLWPIEFRSSCIVGTYQVHNIPVLNIHELSAGKLSALIDRKTGRDLFDAYHLLTKYDIDFKKLRLALIIYSGMNRKTDLRNTTPQDINIDTDEFINRLVPLLRKKDFNSKNEIIIWSKYLVDECHKALAHVLPLTEGEIEFLTQLLEHSSIEPELLSDDQALIENIKLHPALRWTAQNVKNNVD
jgi:predicted nucleotidyltransferase component of viral defense system